MAHDAVNAGFRSRTSLDEAGVTLSGFGTHLPANKMYAADVESRNPPEGNSISSMHGKSAVLSGQITRHGAGQCHPIGAIQTMVFLEPRGWL